MKNAYFFSNIQIKEMKQAIGWDATSITGTKYRRFVATKNAYFTKSDHAYWNKLCDQSLAEKSKRSDSDGFIYKLSVEGIYLLEELTDVKIEFSFNT